MDLSCTLGFRRKLDHLDKNLAPAAGRSARSARKSALLTSQRRFFAKFCLRIKNQRDSPTKNQESESLPDPESRIENHWGTQRDVARRSAAARHTYHHALSSLRLTHRLLVRIGVVRIGLAFGDRGHHPIVVHVGVQIFVDERRSERVVLALFGRFLDGFWSVWTVTRRALAPSGRGRSRARSPRVAS